MQKKLKEQETKCFNCSTKIADCSFMRDLKLVKGSSAIKTDRYGLECYKILECPQYSAPKKAGE